MVCYARPASRLAAIVFVAWLVFAVPVSHFFNTAALVTAVTVATVGAAGVAALAFATFRSARRRRAAAGGCVSCQFRCQHAMTEPTGRFWLVTIADRRPPAPAADRRPRGEPRPGGAAVAGPACSSRRPGISSGARDRPCPAARAGRLRRACQQPT